MRHDDSGNGLASVARQVERARQFRIAIREPPVLRYHLRRCRRAPRKRGRFLRCRGRLHEAECGQYGAEAGARGWMEQCSGNDPNHGQTSLIDTMASERNAIRTYFVARHSPKV